MTTNPAPSLETRFEQLLELVQAQQSRMETQQTHIEAQQSRITELEAKLASSPLPTQKQTAVALSPAHQGRRRFLQKVAGLALVSGVGATVALARPTTAEAKLSVHPTGQGMTGRVGALLQVSGAAAPTGTLPNTTKIGLIVTSDSTLDLSTLAPIYDMGVFGISSGGYGLYGSSTSNHGVAGTSTNYHGVYGTSASTNCAGVLGSNISGTGVWGYSGNYYGVYGYSGTSYGVVGNSNSNNGVYGISINSNGVYGTSTNGHGVGGDSTSGYGVVGSSTTGTGVYGSSNTYIGVVGVSTNSYGVYGTSTNSYAGWFQGNVNITGSITKSSGTFKIDHPLDPAHKYLSHSFVESPDMLNIYNGNVILDANGEALIELPTWFEALNRDFRYQLTAIGQASPDLFISEEIANNRFKIAGGKADQRVSWQVTGIRQDAWANANRVQVEEDKTEAEQGKYLHPEAFGLPREGNSIAEHHIPDVPPAPPAPPSDKGIGEK